MVGIEMKIITICDDYYHKGQKYENAIRRACPSFKHEFIYKPKNISPNILDDCDLLIIARAETFLDEEDAPWMSDEFIDAFVDYAKNGGGILVLHSGIVGYGKNERLSKIFGGYFDFHPPETDVAVNLIKGYGITKGIDTFVYPDEHYHVVLTEKNLKIFAYAKSEHSTQPAAWFNTKDNQKVCVLVTGHTDKMLESAEYLKILKRAINWCVK